MKRILHLGLVSLLTFLITSTGDLRAQCTVSEIFVQNVVVIGSTANSCTIKFDVTFNIADNNGNKFIFIHAWLQNQYPNYFDCVDGHPSSNGSIRAPRAADLGNSFINIGIDNTGATPVVLTSYPPDASVPMALMDSATKVVLPDGSANITLYGVIATSPFACTGQAVIVADLWSSQSATAQRAHCVNCGIRSSAGYLSVTGLVNCFTLTYNGTITNLTGLSIDGFYRVFADVNHDGYFTPTTDTILQTATTFSVGAFGTVAISGPIPAANLNQDIFVVVTQTTGSAATASRVYIFHSTLCSPLPVTISYFTASRSNDRNVLLRWETVTEINNAGFTIERNTGNNWSSTGFVRSQALNGNSNSLFSYSFIDTNSSRTITQYRLRQTDFDNHSRYSDIRTVRGSMQKSKVIIYPNPATNGNVNVVLENGHSDLRLTDVSGHLIRQWSNLAAGTLHIEKLHPGVYFLRVNSRETGTRNTEKIIVY